MKSRLQIGGASGTALLLLCTVSALAQPTVTAVSPAANQRNAPRTGPVTFTFDQPLNAGSVAALKVFSSQRGGQRVGHSGTAVVSGNTLTFTPSYPFQAGETVRATLTTAAQNAGGQSVAHSRIIDFRTATASSTGLFGGGMDFDMGYSFIGEGDVTVGDFDNDGDLDFLVNVTSRYTGSAGTQQSGIRQFINDGTGVFTQVPGFMRQSTFSNPFRNLLLGDLDNDGDLDLLHTNQSSRIDIELGNGSGAFPTNTFTGTGPAEGHELVDIDGDGDLDAFQVGGVGIQVLLNTGNSTFTLGTTIPSVQATADVDGDGDIDFLFPDYTNLSTVRVQLNDGQGNFTAGPVSVGVSNAAFSTATMGDIDGDNDVDMVTSVYQPANISAPCTTEVRLNNGGGTFSTSSVLTATTGAVALADIDGDGDLDIVAAGATGVAVFLNSGSGTFAPSTTVLPIAGGPGPLTLADLDGDGDLDFITRSYPAGGNTPSTFLNVRFNQNAPLATRNGALAAQMSISPNPAHARFAVRLPALPGTATATLTLRNALGQVVLTKPQALLPTGTQTELEAAGLAPGLYLLSVQAGADTFAKRVVLE